MHDLWLWLWDRRHSELALPYHLQISIAGTLVVVDSKERQLECFVWVNGRSPDLNVTDAERCREPCGP